MVSLSLSEESAAGTCRSLTTREPSGCETQQRRLRIQPVPRPLARSYLKLHSVAYLNKIRFHPFPDENRINIKTVAHRGAAIEDLRLGNVGEEETKIAGEDFVNIAEPGASIVLRHEVQFDEQELCLRQSLFRASERPFFVTLDVNFQKRNLRKAGQQPVQRRHRHFHFGGDRPIAPDDGAHFFARL